MVSTEKHQLHSIWTNINRYWCCLSVKKTYLLKFTCDSKSALRCLVCLFVCGCSLKVCRTTYHIEGLIAVGANSCAELHCHSKHLPWQVRWGSPHFLHCYSPWWSLWKHQSEHYCQSPFTCQNPTHLTWTSCGWRIMGWGWAESEATWPLQGEVAPYCQSRISWVFFYCHTDQETQRLNWS